MPDFEQMPDKISQCQSSFEMPDFAFSGIRKCHLATLIGVGISIIMLLYASKYNKGSIFSFLSSNFFMPEAKNVPDLRHLKPGSLGVFSRSAFVYIAWVYPSIQQVLFCLTEKKKNSHWLFARSLAPQTLNLDLQSKSRAAPSHLMLMLITNANATYGQKVSPSVYNIALILKHLSMERFFTSAWMDNIHR